MTQKQKRMLYNHMQANAILLNQLYKKPSPSKEAADMYCQKVYADKHGYNMRYHSANSHFFSFSFKYREGRSEYLYYMTYTRDYAFKIADIDEHGRAIPVIKKEDIIMGKKESMLVYIDDFNRNIDTIKQPISHEELIFIRETIATMQGIIIAYIGYDDMEEVVEKANRLQNDCYDLWHLYAYQNK